jgi:hypothetical protein
MERERPEKALKVAMSREHDAFETGDIGRPSELQYSTDD